tara:strand:+ start:41 stop:499 length:459 start_codon:yes stop_codon:yes gene_type:complete
MANTTFSGPIKAGSISNTTGTTVGSNMANVGYVLMSQTEAVDQTAVTGTTNIIIPANSQLVSAALSVSVVWNGAATTAGLGYVGDATAFTAATGIAGGTLGIIDITAGAVKVRVDAWADVGTTDRRLLLTHGNTGTGVGWLTVTYIQNVNVG